MDQSDLQSVWELIQQIDIGAFGYISNPETTKWLNSRDDLSPEKQIMGPMTDIINAGSTDTRLSLIIKNWQDVDRQNTSAFNTWLTGLGKTGLKINENGKAWNDLDSTRQVYYGTYLQICKNLELVK